MKKALVLFIVVLGTVGAASASADPPAGEAGESGSSDDGATTYVVQYRDSVEKVARQFGVTAEEIISANPRAVAPRNVCEGLRERTLQSGVVITTCRRVEHWFRRAGMTITIPASRAVLEAETVRLNAELAALRAERDEAREERDALSTERDAQEAASTEPAQKANEPEVRHSEPEQSASAAPPPAARAASCPMKPDRAPAETCDDGGKTVIVVAALLLALIGLLYQHYRPSQATRRLAKKTQAEREQVQADREQVAREQAALEAMRAVVAREARGVAEERRQLETQKMELATERREFEAQVASITAALRRREAEVMRKEAEIKRPSGPPPRKATAIGVPPIFPPIDPKAQADRVEALFLHVLIARGRKLLEEKGRELDAREAVLRDRAREALAAAGRQTDQEALLQRREEDLTAAQERLNERIEAARQEGAAAKAAELATAQAELERKAAERTQAQDDREGTLQTWADRLADKERALAPDGDDAPTIVDGKGMAVPPPLPEPGSGSVTGIDLRAQLLPRQVDSVDIEDETHYAVPGGENPPASAAVDTATGGDATSSDCQISCGACGRKFAGRREFDEHRLTECPKAKLHVPTIPPSGPPAAHTGSCFFCRTCERDVPMDDYDDHNAAHQAQEKLGPLSPSEGG